VVAFNKDSVGFTEVSRYTPTLDRPIDISNFWGHQCGANERDPLLYFYKIIARQFPGAWVTAFRVDQIGNGRRHWIPPQVPCICE
jgi:hypothetical protein